MPRISVQQRAMEEAGLVPATASNDNDMRYPDAIQSDELRTIFARIYRANPSAHLYTDASEPILIQLMRHIANANRISREIQRARDPELLIKLSRAQRDESAAIASLSNNIRPYPSSIADHRGNLLPKAAKKKPWEWD